MQNNNTLAGKIEVEEGKGKLKFYAFNHQRGQRLHIGTLQGMTYEKAAVILRQPEASLCLSQTEYAAIEEAGGQFIRFIVDRAQTYSISLNDFVRNAEKFYNPSYGGQYRVALRFCVFANAVQKRNAQVDNPVIETGSFLERVAERQMPLFG